jgi:hypothetical protein
MPMYNLCCIPSYFVLCHVIYTRLPCRWKLRLKLGFCDHAPVQETTQPSPQHCFTINNQRGKERD